MRFQKISPHTSIVTGAPRAWIKPLSTLYPGDLSLEHHVEGVPSRGKLGRKAGRLKESVLSPA